MWTPGCFSAVAVLAASVWPRISAQAAARPNIVFILQDDLGFFDTAIYGNKDAQHSTQHITELARNGVVLGHHYVHWHCSPTRRSFLTGRLPLHHGEFLSSINNDDIDLRWTWISEKLKSAGYVGHWYGKGHTGYKSMNHLPALRGFDGGSVLFLAGSGSYTTLPRWNGTRPLTSNTEYSTDLFGSLAVKAVMQHDTSRPLFLYLPFQAVHAPYDLPPGSKKKQCPRRIPCMLHDADYWVGELVTALKFKAMYDQTLIIYSSDNGGVDKGINYPLRGEKHTNWQGAMQVTAFVSGGFVPESARGTKFDGAVHIVDWYPTLARLAGVDGTDDPPVKPLPVDPAHPEKDIYQGHLSFPPVDGRDIWPLITRSSTAPVRESLWLSAEVLVRGGRYKLVVAQPKPELMNDKSLRNGWEYPNGTWVKSSSIEFPCNAYWDRKHFQPCLFDLETDPREMHNLAADMPSLLGDMWAELNRTALTAFTSRSPSELLGSCHKKCAGKKWGGAPGPICGVPGCEWQADAESDVFHV